MNSNASTDKEEYPERLDPLWALTVYAWDFLRDLYDGLLAVNPYTHSDEPWLATSWSYEVVQGGMDITFNLRLTDSQGEPVTWQDGKPVSVNDVKFSWNFLHNWCIPTFWASFKFYDPENTAIIDQDTIRARITTIDHMLAYDLAANRNCWMTTQGITDKIEYMFWRAGDVSDNDVIDVADLAAVGSWYNQAVPPAPNEVDIVGPGASLPDEKVDIDDLVTVAKYFGETETVPH